MISPIPPVPASFTYQMELCRAGADLELDFSGGNEPCLLLRAPLRQILIAQRKCCSGCLSRCKSFQLVEPSEPYAWCLGECRIL
jgi:hypothetical protein